MEETDGQADNRSSWDAVRGKKIHVTAFEFDFQCFFLIICCSIQRQVRVWGGGSGTL